MSKLLIAGATGLVGRHVLAQALAGDSFEVIVAPTRRPLPPHDRLLNPVIDFDRFPKDAAWWSVDAFICTLGTTGNEAGSDAVFRRVDYEYPLAMASLVRQRGATSAALCSAQGAGARSPFYYFRTKGELENALLGIGFFSTTIAQPAMIGGRQPLRPSERRILAVLSGLDAVLPRRLRINPAAAIARALLDPSHLDVEGRHIIKADRLCGSLQERRSSF